MFLLVYKNISMGIKNKYLLDLKINGVCTVPNLFHLWISVGVKVLIIIFFCIDINKYATLGRK
jgi:hypothetical protein